MANLKKIITLQKLELSNLHNINNRQRSELERQEAIISADEREIDLLRNIKAEHKKQLEDKIGIIRHLTQTIENLQKDKEESSFQISKLREEIQLLKSEIDRINSLSVLQRIIGKK